MSSSFLQQRSTWMVVKSDLWVVQLSATPRTKATSSFSVPLLTALYLAGLDL
eukprot:CAMPEP_0119114480 /NCGR_PEP_ID=MMETSP1180-20130426/47662_1 /TAXON_ID=3052 ORGANISM="Chlamydomonas cf sp, Strain CCMP681" /NCGR_SAMPLE_ID=MMETSP1180 /ASSEMBLY_ACC=CAM_ASM_000741 /LENGTH=51 /DNA_ID=CAMNT_0007103041 /DNA_START=95 /DNA_END=247 /DNA_ORIENTATION=-